jgi:hypothetical protein
MCMSRGLVHVSLFPDTNTAAEAVFPPNLELQRSWLC